jgi:acyl-CoA synthetase (AMP-forming)/AMP-acid ligase II
MLKRIVEYPNFDEYDLSSVRVITYGAAACPYEVLEETIERFLGRALINAFGGTETSSTIAALRAEDQVITGQGRPPPAAGAWRLTTLKRWGWITTSTWLCRCSCSGRVTRG